MVCKLKIYILNLGWLAGSIDRACDSRSQGCDVKPHVGCRDYLKILKKKINILNFQISGTVCPYFQANAGRGSILKNLRTGVPGWLSQLRVQLLVSAQAVSHSL